MDLLRNRIVLGIGALVILLAAAWAYFAYLGPQPPTRPLIIFEETIPATDAVAGQPVVIFATVSDPEGIAEVELWINGDKVSTQTNDPATGDSFNASLAFIPSGAGNYLAMLRALDGDGYSGDSDPLAVTVLERTFGPDPNLLGEYAVLEGDTPEGLAAIFGTTVDDLSALNPDLGDLTPGERLLVPPHPETGAAGGVGGLPDELDDTPVVDPPLPSTEPREAFDGEPPEPPSEPWWYVLPLPDGFICFINPASCGRAISHEPAPFPAPSDIFVDPLIGDPVVGSGADCGFAVHWIDNSENEDGFRVYRFTSRPRFRADLLYMTRASEGTGTLWSAEDTNPPSGEFFYSVVAFNSGGETWSAPSETIVSEGCPPEGPIVVEPLVVEILELETEEPFDKLYCYASLAGSPFERVPYGASNFITLEAGEWNIAEHFSGANRREVYAPSAGPLTISGECLGWQGEELIRIGLFNDSSMPGEWDGRLLNASMSGGTGFNFTYRVNHSFHAAEESGRAAWPLVDPSIPSPYNLRLDDFWQSCWREMGGFGCNRFEESGLHWNFEYELPEGGRIRGPGESGPPVDFKIYRRLPGESVPRLIGTAVQSWSFPLPPLDCSTATFFSVSAVVGNDPLTGGEIQSPLSEEFEVPPTCASLEITLDFLWVYGVYDGDPCTAITTCRNDYEAYGWVDFNGHRIRWNDHCDPGLFGSCMYVGPSYSVLDEATGHNWSSFNLNIGDGWRRSNNVIRIPIEDGESLRMSFTLMDHQDWSDDYAWCGATGRPRVTEGPHTAAEWLSFDQVLEFDGGGSPSDHCIIRFHVRGLPPE